MSTATEPPEAPDPDLLKRLEGLARQVFDATKGCLTAKVQAEVTICPGGMVIVRYMASSGEVLGEGVNRQRLKFGDSPEAITASLIQEVGEADIARKIRTAHLQRMAKELGFEIKRKEKKS